MMFFSTSTFYKLCYLQIIISHWKKSI